MHKNINIFYNQGIVDQAEAIRAWQLFPFLIFLMLDKIYKYLLKKTSKKIVKNNSSITEELAVRLKMEFFQDFNRLSERLAAQSTDCGAVMRKFFRVAHIHFLF